MTYLLITHSIYINLSRRVDELLSLEQFYCHPFENGIETSCPIVVAIKLSGGRESRGFSVSSRISSLLSFVIAAFGGSWHNILGRLATHHVEVSA